jgi:hypothetical protein
MNQSLSLEQADMAGSWRIERALDVLRNGRGVLVRDDEDRENEADLIFPAETLTREQMAMLIRECSGIVCLCLTDEQAEALDLPPMVERNTSQFGTAFTVTIEAARGVTTGVSAADRLRQALGLVPAGTHLPAQGQTRRSAGAPRPHRGHGGPHASGRIETGRGPVRADQS